MSCQAIYRQPVPGNRKEEKVFKFECSHIFHEDQKKLFEKILQLVVCKTCLVCQGPYVL